VWHWKLLQSAFTWQPIAALHDFGQPPPQSTSVSAPFIAPSEQVPVGQTESGTGLIEALDSPHDETPLT
jgi:hypothetical protein